MNQSIYITKSIKIAYGTKTKNTPNVVATAFPPLNFKNNENVCPSIAAIPITIISNLSIPVILVNKSAPRTIPKYVGSAPFKNI